MLCVRNNKRPAAFSLVGLLVIVGVLAVLAGLIVRGGYWLRCRAEEADVTNRAGNLGYALHLYYLEHRNYPSAYPAHLDTRLAPYLERELSDCVDTPEAFVTPASPGAGAEPLNESYAPPPKRGDQISYVLAVQPKRSHARTAVLFGVNATQLVETLPVRYAGAELKPGDVVQGGTITFATGTSVEAGPDTMMRVIRSFRTEDGSVYHVVKVPRYKPGFLRADVVGADLVQIVTGAGVVFVRNGVADIDVIPVELAAAADEAGEEETGDDPIRTTHLATEEDDTGAGKSLGDFALFSLTQLQVGGNASVDHLIGSNGDVELGAESDTTHIVGGGSLVTGANLTAAGNVVFMGDITLTGNTEITGDLDSSGSVVLDGASVGGTLTAAESVSLKNGSVRGDLVSGGDLAVGPNGSAQGTVSVDGDLTMEANARTYGSVEYTGTLTAKPKQLVGGADQVGSVDVSVTEYTAVGLPFPTLFTAGSQDIEVSADSSRTLEPGQYGNLVLAGGAQITFSEGRYSFQSITAQGNVSLTFDVDAGCSGTEILVAGDVSLGGAVQSEISGTGSAADIYLETGGDFDITGNATWRGTVYAPSGHVNLAGNSTLYGACYASGPVGLGHHGQIFYTQSSRGIGSAGATDETDGDGSQTSDEGSGSGSDTDGTADDDSHNAMETFVRVSNHSADVTVDARVRGRGTDIGPLPRRQDDRAGKSNGRSLTRGAHVSVGRWVEATPFRR